VGRNKEAIKRNIQNQLKEDEMLEQMTIKEYYDPFTGEEYPKHKSDKINPFTDRKKTQCNTAQIEFKSFRPCHENA